MKDDYVERRKRFNAEGFVAGMGEEQLRWHLEAVLREMEKLGVAPEQKYIGKTPPRQYDYDVSHTNPGLHELYTGWAMKHLASLNAMIQELDDFSNLNMDEALTGLWTARQNLIDNNTAYRDAAARLMAGHQPPSDNDCEQPEPESSSEDIEAAVPDDADFYTILATRTKLSRPDVKIAVYAIQGGIPATHIMKIVEPEMNKLIDERPDLFRERPSNNVA